jgi:hypothetical protein
MDWTEVASLLCNVYCIDTAISGAQMMHTTTSLEDDANDAECPSGALSEGVKSVMRQHAKITDSTSLLV